MAHPKQFDDRDPTLKRVRGLCLDMPGADEKISHGRPAFFTKKIFAIYGAVLKGDHHAGRYDQAVIFRPDDDERPALLEHDRVIVPAYYGPAGWLAYDLGPKGADWDELTELIHDSFRNTATKKLIAQLET